MDTADILRQAMKNPDAVGKTMPKMTFDDVSGHAENLPSKAQYAAESFAQNSMRMLAASVLRQWAAMAADDLEAGETWADRLMSLFIGAADEDKNGDLSENEQETVLELMESAWDYLLYLDVDEALIGELLNDWSDSAADMIRQNLADELQDDEDDDLQNLDQFVFADEEQSQIYDAVYKKEMVVRNGKKTRINKRLSGAVRLTAKQKAAIKKARQKSHSASANMRRLKSMRVRQKMGL